MAQETGTDADVGGGVAGEEERAVCGCGGVFESEFGLPVGGEETAVCVVGFSRDDGEIAVENDSLGEAGDGDGDDDSCWECEGNAVPIALAARGDDEFEGDGKVAGCVCGEFVARGFVEGDVVVCGGWRGGECSATGEEIGGRTGGIGAGGGGQGEGDGLGIFRDFAGDGGVEEFESA